MSTDHESTPDLTTEGRKVRIASAFNQRYFDRVIFPSGLIHCICHYHGQWIPGDERGFRSRNHRIHSSGDYRNPPPIEEHAGLRRWVRQNLNHPPVVLIERQFEIVGGAFVHKLVKMQCQVFVLSAGPTHVHGLFLPTEKDVIKQLGKAKQYASLKCPDSQGQLWGESSEAIPIRDERHAQNAFVYICDHAIKEGAWVWRFDRDAPVTKHMIEGLVTIGSGPSSLRSSGPA